MIAEHFTRRWQDAGLIDGELARRIVAWEAAHRRPVLLWAIAGMGALAVSLGIMAVVGANWERIPAALKLATDLALNAAAAAVTYVAWRRGWTWRREISALLLFGLVLSGIALIGQVYQLQSAPWRALTLWLMLSTPFLALAAFSWLNGTIWAIAAVTTWFMANAPLQDLVSNLWAPKYQWPLMGYLAACWMILIAVLRGLWTPARGQADLMLRLALAGLIAACSLTVAFAWIDRGTATSPTGPILAAAAASVAAAAALWLGRVGAERRLLLALLAGSLLAWAVALPTASMEGRTGDVVRALLFILYWAGIGAVAAAGGRRVVFGLAFTLIGVRILILYFEAIGGLTATGLGLIGGGVLCLALAAAGWRLTRGVPRRAAETAP
jgi:uncharacterized membrane protein